MIEKRSKYKNAQMDRDVAIYHRFKELMEDGYMKMQAYQVLCEEFNLFSNAGVYKAILRGEEIDAEEKSDSK